MGGAEKEEDVTSTLAGESSDNEPVASIPIIPNPAVPTIAPIPSIPLPHRPLAPIPVPVRPPLLLGNGDVKPPLEEDSDSDEDGDGDSASPHQEYEVSEQSRQIRELHQKKMQEFLLKRRAAALAVPTNDKAVRARLRRLGHPITLFGEREMERRDRLRLLMAKFDSDGHLDKLMKAFEEDDHHHDNVVDVGEGEDDTASPHGPDQEIIHYPFYTEGPNELLHARLHIAQFSIPRAASRLHRARTKRLDPDEDHDAEIDWALNQAASLLLDCSEIGDDRPLSGCSFSTDGKLLATCSLSGVAKTWNMPQLNNISTLKGHTERATDVAFSPACNQLATASADRTARLWNTDGSLLRTFEGHLDRLARIAFHPSGKYLGTTSFDKTWRLWDVDTGIELLLQEGHSRSVYGIAFHHDGSLAGSCGLDAVSRVWDLRTGRSILALEGHVKPVLGISFSPNGYHVATGGEDNTCRIWDLRKKKTFYTIPAHSNLISQVKFEPQEGYYLVTASYDMTAKVWSGRDFKPVKVLSGHEAKVTSLDVGVDGRYIATVSHDRTTKLWSSSNSDKDAMDVD